MKLLHTADWQIGKRYGQFDPEEAALLAEARFDVVSRIAELACSQGVNLVLVAGDVFDAQGVSDRTVLRLFQLMSGFAGPWVMIPGNHDAGLAESVWTRATRLRAIPENVHVRSRPEPLVLNDPSVVILPAPLTQRHTYEDLTRWFDSVATSEGIPRIGLAHGSVQGILAKDIDATNPIAAERAGIAQLDYLALGDWHGTKQIDARTWYSGTPETDRFRNNESGQVLLVEITAPGNAPAVTPMPTGRYRWRDIERELQVASDVSSFVHELEAFDTDDVVQIKVRGHVDLESHLAVSRAIGHTQARTRSLVVDLSELHLLPTDDDLHALRADGYLGEVIADLRAQEDGDNAEVARDALALLAGILDEALITEPTSLVLPGIGSLEIVPGGSDLAEVARELRSVAERQAALLERLGLSSLEEAETRREMHRAHEAEAKMREATLKILAPAGIDALRSELATLSARLEECEKRLAQLPARPDDVDRLPSVDQADVAEENARRDLERRSEELNQAHIAAANARSAFEAAQREVQAAQAKLEAPDRAERLRKAQADLLEAKAESARYADEIETLEAKISAARPDVLVQDIRRWRASAEALARAYDDRRVRIERLEAELQALGAQGLEEKRADVARNLEQTRRRVAEMQRRANALDYLLELLRRKRAAVTQRLHAPLQRHLNHYVQLLFPHATLELGEDFVPRLLSRPGAEVGDFHDMSFGAREQTGVISRLAYADLLKEAGRPTLIMLDDALVHSDDGRLGQMKRVLFDAATRHQILLFSCHPEKWRDLGVGARSVEALLGS